jgi:integrase
MARPVQWPPTVHRHVKGGSYVRWKGKTHWLGPHGSDQARRKYAELVAALARGSLPGRPDPDTFTVADLAAWWDGWAVKNYPPTSREPRRAAEALRPLVELFGSLPARDLSPRRLKEYVAHCALHWCRNVLNRQLVRVKTVLKRAVEEELVPGQVYQDCRAVRALPPGAPGVRETQPVSAADPVALTAVLPHCPAPVAGMLAVQALTGMRSCEVRLMRPVDIERAGEVWTYRPQGGGKTAHRGHRRVVAIGPQAQAVLAPFLLRCPAPDAYLFRPEEAPRSRGRKRNPCYSDTGYCLAVARACLKAGVPRLFPYQLRHLHRNLALAAGGVAGAMASLGQKSTRAFDGYGGGQNLKLAAEIARKIG